MKRLRALISLLLCALLLALPFPVFAKEANIYYEGDAGDLIFEPGSKYSPTDLFPNFKNVLPGDTVTQKITLRNRASNKVKVKIYMRSLGAAEGTDVDFLNQLRLTVKTTEETPMFVAQANETDGLTDWVCLGLLYSGGEVDLNVTLEVPVDLDDLYQDLRGDIVWQFMVEEFPREPDDPAPQTGDKTGKVIAICAGIALVLLLLFLLLGRKKKRKEDDEDEP